MTEQEEIANLKLRIAERDATILAQCEIISDLSHKLQTDNMTGVFNRSGTTQRIESMVSQHRRSHSSVFVAFIDVDDFKNVNDTYGHDAGDYTLSTIADRLRASTRLHDIVGRWAGDEFVVGFSLTRSEVASNSHSLVVNRMLEAIRTPIVFEGVTILTSVSVGLIGYTGAEHVDAETLVNAADAQMYLSKDLGKNKMSLKMFNSPSEIN